MVDIEPYSPGAVIVLVEVKVAKSTDVIRLTPSAAAGELILFDGDEYIGIPIEFNGFQSSSTGALPLPELTIGVAREIGDLSDTQTFLLRYLESHNELLASEIVVRQVFEKNLDNGSDPNVNGLLSIASFFVEQLVSRNRDHVKFRLSSVLDQEDLILPRKRAVTYCQHVYRTVTSTGSFDYSNVTCPYTGSAKFTEQGIATGYNDQDICAKTLTSCQLRYGSRGILPFDGFPGVSRYF